MEEEPNHTMVGSLFLYKSFNTIFSNLSKEMWRVHSQLFKIISNEQA